MSVCVHRQCRELGEPVVIPGDLANSSAVLHDSPNPVYRLGHVVGKSKPEFSKVVDENGELLVVVYHGTGKDDLTKFDEGWMLSAWEVRTPGATQKANDFREATPHVADSSDDTRVAGAARESSALARRFVKSMDGVSTPSRCGGGFHSNKKFPQFPPQGTRGNL